VWDAETVRYIIGGPMVPGHRCRRCPREIVVQHLAQRTVVGQADIDQSLVETGNGTAIHFVVYAVAAVHPDHGGLVTIGVGIRAGATECLGPVSGESLDMLGVETVAERMADHAIGHHPTMPGVGKTAQAVVATRCLKDCLHASMMTMVSYRGNTKRPGVPIAEACPVSRSPTAFLGHVSVQTTERYLGCTQRIASAVNDRIGIEPVQ
jgi:hypothetical protein